MANKYKEKIYLKKAIRGAKAGAKAGVIWGFLSYGFILLNRALLGEYFMLITRVQTNYFKSLGPLLLQIITKIGEGSILGAIYEWGYHKIPGRTPILKGTILGMSYGIVRLLIGLLWYIIISHLTKVVLHSYIMFFYPLIITVEEIIQLMVFGVFLGKFYKREITEN